MEQDDDQDCEVCGESLGSLPYDAAAEMYDPTGKFCKGENVICHGQCGLDYGLLIA